MQQSEGSFQLLHSSLLFVKGLIYLFEVPFEESQFYFQGLDCIWIIHFFFLGGARNARKSKASGGIDCAGTSFWEKILIGFKFI